MALKQQVCSPAEIISKVTINSLRPSGAYMHQEINHHWFRQWLVAWLAPSHFLNQCWNIVNWTIRNKLQWNFNRSSNICVQENVFESAVWEMVSILSQPQCVKQQVCSPAEIITKFTLNSLRPSGAYMHQEINHHWFRQWLVPWLAPSHFLNQCWNIVNWTIKNKLQWNCCMENCSYFVSASMC